MATLNGLLVVIRSPLAQAPRRDTIRSTWGAALQRLGARVIFSVHNPGLNTPFLVGDTLQIPGIDAHQNLTPRMIHTFRWLLREESGDWSHVLSMDDDCYVLASRLASLPWVDCDVLGHKNDNWYWSGGPGMILSRRAVKFIDYHLGRDDCAIGALLTAAGPREFSMHHTPDFRPWREVGWPTRDNHTAIQHYVRDPSEMVQLAAEELSWKSQ